MVGRGYAAAIAHRLGTAGGARRRGAHATGMGPAFTLGRDPRAGCDATATWPPSARRCRASVVARRAPSTIRAHDDPDPGRSGRWTVGRGAAMLQAVGIRPATAAGEKRNASPTPSRLPARALSDPRRPPWLAIRVPVPARAVLRTWLLAVVPSAASGPSPRSLPCDSPDLLSRRRSLFVVLTAIAVVAPGARPARSRARAARPRRIRSRGSCAVCRGRSRPTRSSMRSSRTSAR